jgi:hypothetical protein
MARLKDTPAAPTEAPRYALAWAALFYALCTLALGHEALGGGFLVNPTSDQYIAGYPYRDFAAQVLRTTGSFPLWNPYLNAGTPYVAGMHGDIFYPSFLLRMVLPTDVAMTWGFIVHVFLAGLFTYGFLRAVGLGFYAALLGGVAYMMSGQVASFVSPGHDGKLFVSALFPLALWMLVRGVRDGRVWSWGVLAVTVGLGVLSPHPQLLQYMLLASGAFALYLAFGGLSDVKPARSVAIRRLAFALGAVVLGGLIGAVQYLPVFGYVDWSPRAGGAGWEHAISYSMPPEELVNMYLPQFSGILERYWGRNQIHLHSEYLGVAVLVLAGAAFGHTGRRRSFTWFWLGTFIVTLLWALGGFTPFYSLVYALVPGTKYFRAPSTILYVVTFAVAVLAAVGTERVLRRDVGPRYAIGWMAAALLVGLIAAAGGWTNVAVTIAGPERYEAVLANAPDVVLGAWRSFVFVALAAATLLLTRRGRLPYHVAGTALAVIVASDLWSVLRAYWRFSPPAAEIYASDPAIEYIKRQPEPGRVLAWPVRELPGLAPRDVMLTGSGLMQHDVRQVLGYHGNEIGRYRTVYQTSGALFSPNFWQLYNVRYFLTNAGELPLEGAKRLVGPVKDAAGSTVYLYGLPGENPAAWVAPAIVKAPDEVTLATILDPRFPVASTAIFDTSAAVTARTDLQAPPAPLPIKASFSRYEPGHITLQLDAPAPAGSALVVSENYYPGWRATVDGRPATVGRANYTLIGVELPAGARNVDLTFHSGPYETGKVVTWVAIVLAAALIAGGVLVDRRRRV